MEILVKYNSIHKRKREWDLSPKGERTCVTLR